MCLKSLAGHLPQIWWLSFSPRPHSSSTLVGGESKEKVFISTVLVQIKSVKSPRNCHSAAVITLRLLTQHAFKLPLALELLCSNAAAFTQVRGSSGGNEKLKLKNCGEIQDSFFFLPSICCDFKWITATLKMMFPWLDVGPWYSQELELKATVLWGFLRSP